jgi:hypothetical protein
MPQVLPGTLLSGAEGPLLVVVVRLQRGAVTCTSAPGLRLLPPLLLRLPVP